MAGTARSRQMSVCGQLMHSEAHASYKSELIRQQDPWRGVDDVELATLAWVLWFNSERRTALSTTSRSWEFEAAHHHQQETSQALESNGDESPLDTGCIMACGGQFRRLEGQALGAQLAGRSSRGVDARLLLKHMACTACAAPWHIRHPGGRNHAKRIVGNP